MREKRPTSWESHRYNLQDIYVAQNNLRRCACAGGVFASVLELNSVIKGYADHHNKNPKPCIWTAKANDILQKVIRANCWLSSKQNAALH